MKRTILFPILLICLHTSTIISAQNVFTSITSASMIPVITVERGESIFIENVQECLNIIEQEAMKIPMTGVAVAAFIPGEKTTDWISKMRVVGKLADDKVNLLGIAYTKAAEMAVTHQNSGNSERKDMRGEYGYEGGVIKPVNGGYLICAFSGGKSEDDVYAARKGLEWLASKFK